MSLIETLGALESVKARYGGEAREHRAAALRAIEGLEIDEPESLVRYHDLLLFARAYPDDSAMLRLAERSLARIAARVARLGGPDGERLDELRDSGLTGTFNVHTYSWSMLRELLPAYPGRFELNWAEIEDSSGLFELLALGSDATEVLALDDDRIEADPWLLRARGPGDRTDLELLYRFLERTSADEQAREVLFDRLRVPIRWQIGADRDARTTSHRAVARPFYHRDPLVREAPDIRRHVAELPAPKVERLDRTAARHAIVWMKSAMSVRNRELYPLCHPDERDVVVVELERGLSIVCYGVRPPRRFLVETMYGQFLLKNGVPIGYALSSVVGDVCEIGLNVYDTYRAGESAYLYTELIRTFHHLYGANWFWVPRLQAGYGNDEGIESGAFWFYDKLGFRSIDPKIRKLATREREKKQSTAGYRSSTTILRRLVEEDLFFSLDAGRGPDQKFPLGGLGLAATRLIVERFEGDRTRASRKLEQEARRRLGITSIAGWSEDEATALRRLAPLVCLLPKARSWTATDRERLVRMIRAKGSPRESTSLPHARAAAPWIPGLRAVGQAALVQSPADQQR